MTQIVAWAATSTAHWRQQTKLLASSAAASLDFGYGVLPVAVWPRLRLAGQAFCNEPPVEGAGVGGR